MRSLCSENDPVKNTLEHTHVCMWMCVTGMCRTNGNAAKPLRLNKTIVASEATSLILQPLCVSSNSQHTQTHTHPHRETHRHTFQAWIISQSLRLGKRCCPQGCYHCVHVWVWVCLCVCVCIALCPSLLLCKSIQRR